MDGSGVNNDLEQAEQIGQLGETALSVSFPKTKVTHAPAQDCFRRYEIKIPDLPVFATQFSAMECAAATLTGWPTAFLSKVESYLRWRGATGQDCDI
jgi:hypothetical protein